MSQQKLLLFGQANLSEMDSDDKLAAPTWAQSLRAMLSRKTKQTSPAASLDPRGPSEPAEKLRRPAIIIAIAVAVVTVVALALGLGLYFGLREDGSGSSDSGTGPVVDLGYAEYQGNYLQSNISEFLGVRYARAPTDDLRWRAPVEPEKESKMQAATHTRATCLGTGETASDFAGEDCLFLNIWAPTNATPDSKLPVMVYIQGGGYIKNASPNRNGTGLVTASDNNIIFISFNYRVGLFGFLASEEVKSDGDLNVGLLDQRFLFQWLKDNIAQFGGDPDHIVLDGASAGAGSVAMHLVAYGGRDDKLFAGVIAESNFWPAQPYLSDLEYQFDRTLETVACADADNKMNCLRGKSFKELQSANVPSPFPGRETSPLFYWTPCVDGDLLEDLPHVMYEQGKVLKVPVLSGSCTNEGSLFVRHPTPTSGQMVKLVVDNFPDISAKEVDEILEHYPLEPEIVKHDKWFPSTSRAMGDATFICPTNLVLNSLASAANNSSPPLWSYRYNVYDKSNAGRGIGVPHVANNIAVFGTEAFSGLKTSYSTYNAEAVTEVQGYWLSFVRALDPNVHKADASPTWEPWGDNMSRLRIETGKSTMEDVDDGERERCEFWRSISDSTRQR